MDGIGIGFVPASTISTSTISASASSTSAKEDRTLLNLLAEALIPPTHSVEEVKAAGRAVFRVHRFDA